MQTDRSPSVLSAKVLGTIAMVGLVLQPIIVWAFMWLIAPEVAWTEADSNYALGDLGWLRKVGFFATGIGAIALGLGLRRRLEGKGVRLSTTLLFVSGAAQFGAGIFNTDPNAEGSLHDLFGLLSMVTLLSALFALRALFSRNEDWKALALPTLLAAIWFVISVVAAITNVIEPGYVQRFLTVPVLAWLVWIAWNVRQGRTQGSFSEEASG